MYVMAIKQDFHGFHSILVDVDALGQQHPALDEALNLAKLFQARVKVVDVIWDVPPSARSFVTPRLEGEIVENHREHLVRLARWRQRPVPVETAILRYPANGRRGHGSRDPDGARTGVDRAGIEIRAARTGGRVRLIAPIRHEEKRHRRFA
jgi:hypothetical protein